MIVQVNIWICDICNKKRTTINEVDIYSDPVVVLSDEEWHYLNIDGKELLACLDCQKKNEEPL